MHVHCQDARRSLLVVPVAPVLKLRSSPPAGTRPGQHYYESCTLSCRCSARSGKCACSSAASTEGRHRLGSSTPRLMFRDTAPRLACHNAHSMRSAQACPHCPGDPFANPLACVAAASSESCARAQSRCRCGGGEPYPSADMAGVSLSQCRRRQRRDRSYSAALDCATLHVQLDGVVVLDRSHCSLRDVPAGPSR